MGLLDDICEDIQSGLDAHDDPNETTLGDHIADTIASIGGDDDSSDNLGDVTSL